MIISPQLGHGNFVDSMPGAMILWQEEHIGMATATDFSANQTPLGVDGYRDVLTYICCVK